MRRLAIYIILLLSLVLSCKNSCEMLHKKSLEISIKALGSEHPDIGMTYCNLGVAYLRKGEYMEAINYLKKALEITLKKLGDEHPNNISIYSALGNTFLELGNYLYLGRLPSDDHIML